MATIYLSHEVSDHAEQAVRRTAAMLLLRDPNWSGAEIDVQRDENTWVDCTDGVAGSQLLAQVHRAIADAEGVEPSGYAVSVPDNVHNTGLDSAVFATLPEAEQAAKVCRDMFPGVDLKVHATQSAPNTDFVSWNNAGW